MIWQESVAVAVVLLGLGAGAFLVAQRPSFWIDFVQRLRKALLPLASGGEAAGVSEVGQTVKSEPECVRDAGSHPL